MKLRIDASFHENKGAFAGFQQSAKPCSANVTPLKKTVEFSTVSQAGKEKKKCVFFFICVTDKNSLRIKSVIFVIFFLLDCRSSSNSGLPVITDVCSLSPGFQRCVLVGFGE